MKLLTRGDTGEVMGLFHSSPMCDSFEKCYISSDNASDPTLKRLVHQDLYELIIMARKDLHWHQERQTGIVFHMIGGLSEYRKLGNRLPIL